MAKLKLSLSMSNQLILGDCIEKMRELPECSVDSVVCDPPYFLIGNGENGFMGKDWDGIIGLWKYLWHDNTFVSNAERCFIHLPAEKNMEELNTVPKNVCIKESGSGKKESARLVTKVLKSCAALKKDSVHLIAITKGDLLDLLKESSLSHIKIQELFLNGEKDNALFVIPILLQKTENNIFAQRIATELFRVSECEERKIIGKYLFMYSGVKGSDVV